MKKQLLIAGTAVLLLALGLSGCEELFQTENQEPETEIEWFQTGNTRSMIQIQPKQSNELMDNRLGQLASLESDIHSEEDAEGFVYQNLDLGLKWVRLTIDWLDWNEVESTGIYSEYSIDPPHDTAISDLVEQGIDIMYCLVYWDEAIQVEEEDYSRFKAEDEIQRYLNYTKFIVNHFKDRVEYYELLNEPNVGENTQQDVKVADYINLVERTVPVIREEYPEAKIVVGAITPLWEDELHSREYFFSILESDVMPLVDGVSWHVGAASPDYEFFREHYYNYTFLVQEIKDVASAHGFEGEYIAEELLWRTPVISTIHEPWVYSNTVSAKYYARGIVMHLGMNITTGLALESLEELPLMVTVIRNLGTIMAGAKAIDLPIEIQSEATNIMSYSFSLSNGDKLIALWTDGVAVDEDPGVKANLTVQGITSEDVTGIDILNGYQQPIITSSENGNLIIQNLIVRDYPLILRIAKSSQ